DTVALQEAQVGPQGCRLAGDRRAGEAAGAEVGEVAAQGPVVECGRLGTAPALGPGDEFADVVLVRRACVCAATDKGGCEVVGAPRRSRLRRWPLRHAHARLSDPAHPAATLPATRSGLGHRSVVGRAEAQAARRRVPPWTTR